MKATFRIKEDGFYLNNRKVFLNSGEIHYFRIEKQNWRKHLEAAREAGLTTVSSYIPWVWHEPEEGLFDFTGKTCPERDIISWFRLCRELGLKCIVKPGPFILAEYRGAGIPDWFLNRYGSEAVMRNSRGGKVLTDGLSFFNPAYLEKAGLWYDKILPLIGRQEISRGGPVILMQLCNEIGLFTWLSHQGDYGNDVAGRFRRYLAEKFTSVEEINQLWETDYTDFSAIGLPPDGNNPYVSAGDRSRDHEWHLFWRKYYGEYLRLLSGIARKHGITVPFYHNLPGWIYGHGYEFPVNITMYDDLYGEKSEILFGIDHIPEFLSYRNMHDDRIINDIVSAVQSGKPGFAAEFQCGSREYHVVPNPIELELFYKASIANGLTGWNYYMFSQGKNPAGKGHSGELFYWFTPLSVEGNRGSLFPLVRKMSRIISSIEYIILAAKRKAEVCVLFYPPYYATELERPEEGAGGIIFNPSAIRRPAWFDGLLKVLQILNVDYDMMDLSQSTGLMLADYRQVWLLCTDEMNAADQQTIADYAESGGNCVIFPYLPDRELSQKPCTILRDFLSAWPSGKEIIESPLIELFERRDIKCSNPQITYTEESLQNAEIIAKTLKGEVCGFRKSTGKGSILHLGTWIGFDTEEHKWAYETILRGSGARLRYTASDNEFIIVRERFTPENHALLFAANYYDEDYHGKVSYTHPVTYESISIPYADNTMLWPGNNAMLSPVCIEIASGITLLHITSDILNIEESDNQIEIILTGNRDLKGEILLEGENASNVRFATLSGREVKIENAGDRVVLSYEHRHNSEMIMTINIEE